MNIINVGYHSTNYYVVEVGKTRLLVDCGWPGTFRQFAAEMKRKGIAPEQITHVLVTHFHPDHAGLVQEFKDLGAKLILLESQVEFVAPLKDLVKTREIDYREVRTDDNLNLRFAESRAFLASLGLDGEIIPTPGHSDDSVSLILDEGFAFTGDLPPRFLATEDNPLAKQSWENIYRHNITRVFPAHGS
jgi:glyoxylase-like metal-dependent hydrolase (beta-lactamase superfamily II)